MGGFLFFVFSVFVFQMHPLASVNSISIARADGSRHPAPHTVVVRTTLLSADHRQSFL